MTTSQQFNGLRTIALDQIRAERNVRELNQDDVDALASSIELLGQLVPAIVYPEGDGYVLVAGHKRYAALRQLGRNEMRAEVRSREAEHSERAVENIVRTQLNPYEEAQAVRAMLADGLSEDGAAQALGWAKARVTARVKLLELPERAQEMVGAGTIALSAVDQLRTIGEVSPELLDAVIEYLADGNEWAAERLARQPGWVLDAALQGRSSKVFAEQLSQVEPHELAELRLGKRTEELVQEAIGLHKQLDRYSYGSPPLRFTEDDVDQARAAGVLIEFEHSAPIIVDRKLYRELAKAAIARTTEELREQVAAAAAAKKQARQRANGKPDDPIAEARRTESRRIRELAEQAHGVNLDLGTGLLRGLSDVDSTDMEVARFFVFALLGADYDRSPYTRAGERVARLAVSGIRLVIGEFRGDVTKTKKDGTRGRLRIDYGDHREPDKPIAWLWRFIEGAETAGELYGRALVVIAAEQHASRLVIPSSQRTHPTCWASHKDLAAKALRKLAGPHLPTTLKQLESGLQRAHRDYTNAERPALEAARPVDPDPRAKEVDAEGEHQDVGQDVDELD